MTLYKNQIATLVPFQDFTREMNLDLAINAMIALKEYNHGQLPRYYENYVVFFIDSDKKGIAIWAVTKIIDKWEPVEINNRVRKFTEKEIYAQDSYADIIFND